MKKITLRIQEPSISKIVGSELELLLHEEANILNLLNEADKIIRSKGSFHLSIIGLYFTVYTVLLKKDSMNKLV